MKRFAELKVGNTITAKYYENVVLRLKEPGEKAVDTASEAMTRGAGQRRGGTGSRAAHHDRGDYRHRSEGTVDHAFRTEQLDHSSRIADKAVLKQVKVGDRIDITWTEAVLLSADAPKPK